MDPSSTIPNMDPAARNNMTAIMVSVSTLPGKVEASRCAAPSGRTWTLAESRTCARNSRARLEGKAWDGDVVVGICVMLWLAHC